VRGADEAVRCFFNVCRHRGTRLCDVSAGQFENKIQCPYHAWSYTLDGKLAVAANMANVDGFAVADYPLHEAPCAIWDGFIFINRSTSAPPFKQKYQPILNRFKNWALADLVSAQRITYQVAANWKVIFQNYSECYHCPFVHPQLSPLSSYTSSSNDFEAGRFLGGPMVLSENHQTLSMDGKRCASVLPGVSQKDARLVYFYTLFPSLFISPHPDYVLTHRIERLGVDQTRITCDLLFHPGAINQPDFDPAPAIEFWDLTNRQDWKICEQTQRGITSDAYTPGPYSNLESMLVAFDEYYLSVLTEELNGED
jgi:Rieske 2Fe-2S family protein